MMTYTSHIFLKFVSSTCSRASDFGLMKTDKNGRITDFLEKPKDESLKSMVYASSLNQRQMNTKNYLFTHV